MTKPVDCPNCDSLAYRNGRCGHCLYEEEQDLPSWRARGLKHVRELRAVSKSKRTGMEKEDNE